MELTKVAVLDPFAIYRAGLEHVFRNHAWIKLVHSAEDPKSLMSWLGSVKTDLLITELQFEGNFEFEMLNLIKTKHPALRIIVSTSNAKEPLVRRCMNLGCRGFITKDVGKLELLEAIEDVMSNKYYISKRVNTQLIAGFSAGSDFTPEAKLTMRELQILEMVCQEFNSKEISMELQISEYTVANHRKNISKKLGVKNLAGMVKYALMNGVL